MHLTVLHLLNGNKNKLDWLISVGFTMLALAGTGVKNKQVCYL